MFLVLLLYALFAGVCVVGKTILQYGTPLFIVGSRMFVAGILMLGYQYVFDRSKFNILPKHNWKVVQLAIFNIYLTNTIEFVALTDLDSFKSCFTYNLSPFITALFAYVLFAEKISLKKCIGLGIGFVGFFPMLLGEFSVSQIAAESIEFSWAQGIMLVAVVCNVYGWILLGQLMREGNYTPCMVNGVSMLLGGGIALFHSYFMENWDPLPVNDLYPFLACSLFLLIVSNLICYNLYGYLLTKFSATFLSFAGFTTPLFTAALGVIFLGESINVYFLISASIVFVGLLLFFQEELQKESILVTNR